MDRSAAAVASPGGDGSSGGGVGGGNGGSDSRKRPAPSSASPAKRGKVEVEVEVEVEAEVVPAAVAAAEKKDSGHSEAVSAWAYMLSQFPGIPHVPIHCNEISVGKGENCHICLDGEYVGEDLCLLRHLEQGGPCELEVTSNIGYVAVNGTPFIQGDRVILRGGDEIIFGDSGKHAYIFQHLLRDNEVTEAVPVSAYSLVESGPTISVPTRLAEDNNQTVVESATSPLSGRPFKDVLKQGILSPADIRVTFDNFPYYVSDTTKGMLLSSALIHMKKEFRKCLQDISSLNQRILLSGPSGSEIYQEKLIKALAKHFNARLLILDSRMLCGELPKDVKSNDGAPTFREGDLVEYVGHGLLKSSAWAPAYGSRGKVVLAFENNESSKFGVRFNDPIIGGNNLGGLCEENRGFFCHDIELRPDSYGGEKVDSFALGKLIEVISEESNSSNLIVLLKYVEKSFTEHNKSHSSLRSKLPSGVLIIGSHTQAENQEDWSHSGGSDILRLPGDSQAINSFEKLLNIFEKLIGSKPDKSKNPTKSTKYLNNLFPNKISIEFPQDEVQLLDLKKQLKHDAGILKADANVVNIHKFLTTRGITCNDLQELSIKDQLLTNESVDKIIGSAVSHHLQHNNPHKDTKMVLPVESLKHASSVVRSTHSGNNALKDVITENKFEETLLSNVISPDDTGVTFEDIGALDNVKETLRGLVMLPIQRPELFSKGQLRKPVKGILLFGLPGTGKTMLAKAVATEAGANFINISMSSITSKWFGEGEKYIRAIFSLASKLSPAVIFIDEIDSLLGTRGRSMEHEETRKMKNEFMINWDGLRTKEQERVIVLGATNRPFDLDDAVIRRFPRRLMVSLPDASNREKILNIILSRETLGPEVNLESVAKMTDGYSGSDLKDLCVCAAHCPIQEIIEKEKKEKSLALAEGKPDPPLYGGEAVRPLQIDDFKFALGQVRASFLPDSSLMNELIKKWNNQFGHGGGGSEQKQTSSYFM